MDVNQLGRAFHWTLRERLKSIMEEGLESRKELEACGDIVGIWAVVLDEFEFEDIKPDLEWWRTELANLRGVEEDELVLLTWLPTEDELLAADKVIDSPDTFGSYVFYSKVAPERIEVVTNF